MNLRTLSIATSLSVCAAAAFFVLTGEAQSPVGQPQFEPNQVLVQFRGHASPAARAAARGRVNGVREEIVVAAARRNDGKAISSCCAFRRVSLSPPPRATSRTTRPWSSPNRTGFISIRPRPSDPVLH